MNGYGASAGVSHKSKNLLDIRNHKGGYKIFTRQDIHTMDNQYVWAKAKNELVASVVELGFPKELGEQIAKMLGSPKAMNQMNSYLYNVRPKSAELIVDEALAICSVIDAWHEKKASEAANAKYNEMLMYGFEED